MYDFLLVHHCSSILYHLQVIWRWIISRPWNLAYGHSRSLKLVPFKSLGAVSYLPSIVTMALSCIVCEIQRLIGRKSQNFYNPPVFRSPAGDDPIGILPIHLILIKLEWLGYRMVKKLWQYVKPFSSNIGMQRTDRQTDRQICYINITCDKNDDWYWLNLLQQLTRCGIKNQPLHKLFHITNMYSKTTFTRTITH